MLKKSTILGVPFTSGSVKMLLDQALEGGLVVVPSGPGLAVDLTRNNDYREAITRADMAITDSGAMVLFWLLFRGKHIRRVSGLNFLKAILEREGLKDGGQTFWVHPTPSQQSINQTWLKEQGFIIGEKDSYIAPMYPESSIRDPDLFEQLKTRKPKVIILCIGGGVQERLGWWLREQYRAAGLHCPTILCTGAAIGFLSGNQVNIPKWADRLYLGWLFRCVSEPNKFIPRYWKALPLAWLILRYGSKSPPMKTNS